MAKRSFRLRNGSLAAAVKANLRGLLHFLCCIYENDGIGTTPVVPSCPAAPGWSHRWVPLPPCPGVTWSTPVAQSPPFPRLTKPGSSHLVTVTPHHRSEVIPAQVSHYSLHKFMGLFFYMQGEQTEFRRAPFKHILWIERKSFSHHTKEHPVTALSRKSPFPDSSDL